MSNSPLFQAIRQALSTRKDALISRIPDERDDGRRKYMEKELGIFLFAEDSIDTLESVMDELEVSNKDLAQKFEKIMEKLDDMIYEDCVDYHKYFAIKEKKGQIEWGSNAGDWKLKR